MNRFKGALFGMLAMMLAACVPAMVAVETVSSIVRSPAVQVAGDKVVLEGTRGLILAHNVYQGAAAAVTPFVASKRLPPAVVDRIDVLNKEAYRLLNQADTGLTVAQRAAGVFAIADELNRSIGR